ncbi:ATPase [Leptolyngbya sp. 'hensonii']|uniref:ATP-binding protein n=1 Tax=Leptolyngbya sp. 'hensonii' TaxID=1922337 RepID=UPI00094FFD4A|nr:ATP-binding protein [Leptolyngbya sp. 'hensonii']OLP16640.1 ATPase [Leptolyngbya sp. 'hensonii']
MTNDIWQEINYAYLMAGINRVRNRLISHADPELLNRETIASQDNGEDLDWESGAPPAMEQICSLMGLSAFERDILLLCAGVELDASFAPLCAAAQSDGQRTTPTFSLALAVLPGAHWSALAPDAPLRRWRLIELGSGTSLTLSPLRIDERILHYLVGVYHVDDRLLGMIDRVESTENLVMSHWELAQQIVAAWSVDGVEDIQSLPILQLCGHEASSKRAIAAMACHFLGVYLYAISAYAIPTNPSDLTQFKSLWEREALLGNSVLLIDCDDLDAADTVREGAITYLSESLHGLVIITSPDRRRVRLRSLLAFDVLRPTSSEQYGVWQAALGNMTAYLNGYVESLVSQFSLSPPVIQAACAQVKVRANQDDGGTLKPGEIELLLWDACRSQARPRLDDLAQRIESMALWDDLVLPEIQLQTLREISAHVRQRARVYEHWGFGGKSGRGLGISGLFAGASGTGKTMAAEVLAKELRLDLYRIDLSAVISKYIGETEKNLRRVFDAAELGGVILLFDEADALFGKRSEVKDSHDRHANVEVSYLLQRMEAYRGLSILTTNLKSALDQAFLRRIRFVVQFPFPDVAQRTEIWRRVFPKGTPTHGIVPEKLGQLNVSGGNIRNIALNAAFLAADANESVTMKHLLASAKSEYVKLERPLTDSEIHGWV